MFSLQEKSASIGSLLLWDYVQEFFSQFTQEWDSLQHGIDLIHRALGLAASMTVVAITVDPLQEPASVCFSLSVKVLQQLCGHGEVILYTT